MMISRMCFGLAIVATAPQLLLATPFTNGGWESSGVPAIGPGWVVDTGVGQTSTFPVGFGPTVAGEGTQAALLSGGGESTSTISQTFDTVTGTTYNFSFLYNGVGVGGQTLDVKFDDVGTTNNQLFTNGVTVPASGNSDVWLLFSSQFTAQGTSTKISFTDNTPNASSDALVDDVAITAVPEPGTFAMLLFGTIALWSLRRKR